LELNRSCICETATPAGRDGTLPRGRLRAVVEYIEEHLDGGPNLAQLAAIVGLKPYRFARQFKVAMGLPPHQYVIARRVERAKEKQMSAARTSSSSCGSANPKLMLSIGRFLGIKKPSPASGTLLAIIEAYKFPVPMKRP
jgi:AraC-like DNA-binding protein